MNDQPAKTTKSLKVLFADDEDAFREVFSNELARNSLRIPTSSS